MSRSIVRNALLLAAAASLGAACSAKNNNLFTSASGGGNEPTAGTMSTGSGAGGHASGSSGTGQGGINFTVGAGTMSTGSGATCNHDPAVDGDGDGWTGAEGDCNDCDPNVNPGAIEVIAVAAGDGGVPPAADEDCDGVVDNVAPPCDDNLALDDVDASDGARSIELCQFTTESPAMKKDKKWGVLDAQYVRADGTTFAPGLQVGLEDAWGDNVHVQGGKRMLVISSGQARTTNQTGACGSLSCSSNLAGNPPPGFPQDNPNCPPSQDINDDVGLQVKLRSPTNATGYSFNFKFYSFEYPEWVCNNYNDQFIALVTPPPMGSVNGNISFDSMHNAVSVNLGFFDVCDPTDIGSFASNCFSGTCPSPPNPYCPSGTADLAGTGFDVWDSAGATSWLKSQAPIKGGDELTIRFAMWDTGDSAWDSTTLIDNFQWIANGGTVTVGTDPIHMPK
jgi:hypothetical protein